jgi:hypothetical protein
MARAAMRRSIQDWVEVTDCSMTTPVRTHRALLRQWAHDKIIPKSQYTKITYGTPVQSVQESSPETEVIAPYSVIYVGYGDSSI